MNQKITIPTILILTLMIVSTSIYSARLLGKINTVEISQNDKDLGITPLLSKHNSPSIETDISNIINIALFGLDKSASSKIGRSDSIIIASLDTKHKKIKLTSIMRDTYVNIPDRGMDKINHAYAFGGPELSLKTINQNFNMNIRDFASVDFDGLESIIDTLGGVEITLKENEVSYVHGSSPGTQLLNGKQTLAYSRIRKTGNKDFERTERQRTILENLIHKSLDAGFNQYPKLLSAILPYMDTSLSKNEILKLARSIFNANIKDIEQFRIPVDGYARDSIMDRIYYLVPDTLEDNVELLHQFIYKNPST